MIAAEGRPRRTDPFTGHIAFRSLRPVYGVGKFPAADIQTARDRVLAEADATWLVATASHGHALATAVRVGPSAGP
ncbi:MAG TPA: hypothetical protein VN461_16820 [Vicinamibacteria bacterium]|nr:hypothetical protein [Vicinamibacteria bacterium]